MVTKKTFKNGLRLLTIPMPQVKTAAVLVLVGTGGRYENEKTNGLAHFLEHMLFQGSEKYPSKMALGVAVDSIGAEYNGWTDKEMTAYYIKAESRHFPLLVDVLSQLVCHPLFKEKEIEQERNVILQEIAMREDNPQVKAADTLWEVVFKGNPLGLPSTGEKKSVVNFKREDFVNFKNNYYTLSNVVVAVAGNFSEKEAEELVEKSFAVLPEKKKADFEKFALTQKSFRKEIIKKQLDQAHLVLGFPGFSRVSPKKYAQSLLDIILGSGFSSRLFQKIREEMRLAYYVGSESEQYLDTGLFAVFAGLDRKKVKDGVEAIWQQLSGIKNYDLRIKDDELRKAKDFMRGKMVLRLEEALDVATFYGVREVLLGKTEEPEEILEKIEKVTAGEVSEAAKEIFKTERASLVVAGQDIDGNLSI